MGKRWIIVRTQHWTSQFLQGKEAPQCVRDETRDPFSHFALMEGSEAGREV